MSDKTKSVSKVKNAVTKLRRAGETEFLCANSLEGSGIFSKPVQSVFERLLEKWKERESEHCEVGMLEQRRIPSQSFDALHDNEDKDIHRGEMANRLSHPIVPLVILERMQVVFQVYEQRGQRRCRSVSCFQDPKEREEEEMVYLASLISNREQELETQRHESGELSLGWNSTFSVATTNATSPGIPFSVFERFIAEPFFDFLFPVGSSQENLCLFMDDLKSTLRFQKTTVQGSVGMRPRTRNQTRASFKQRSASEVKALEDLFCVMDTNGDGFLSWDEFSSYILQSGQQVLLANEYRRDCSSENAKLSAGVYDGDRKKKNCTVDVSRFASNLMNFAPTPVNVSVWQQQYPLVRCLFHTEPITHLILAKRGRRYITTGPDGLVKSWRPDPRLVDAHGKPAIVHERNLFSAGAPIVDMVLAPESFGDSEVLAVAAIDCTVTLLRVGTGEILKTFIGRCGPFFSNTESETITASATPTKITRPTDVESHAELLSSKRNNSNCHSFGGTMVLRPTFKVRAYRREAIDIFFTDTSRYFAGLGVVAPTYEHLESRHSVKLDVLLRFGECTDLQMKKNERFCLTSSHVTTANDAAAVDADHDICKSESGRTDTCEKNNTSGGDCSDGNASVGDLSPNINFSKDIPLDIYLHEYEKRQRGRSMISKTVTENSSRRICVRDGERCWYARAVAFAKCQRAHSTSIIRSGVFLLLGFDTGVLQIYPMRVEWFTIANLSTARIEPPAFHEPVISLTLHRDTIMSILTSEQHDLVMTASKDGTVVVRHISRVHVPYVTLGDGVPSPGRTLRHYPSGHTKRITCMCLNSSRCLIVTGGADRCVIFWNFSSSRALYRLDISTLSSNSFFVGIPIDVSFFQPKRQPLLLLILDSKRTMYFIDSVSFSCLNILHDSSPASLRAGDMLRVCYDVVDERLILGGRHLRVWETNQSEEYSPDYCGHRRPIVGIAYQPQWGFWVTADDSLIIIWNMTVEEQQTALVDRSEKNISRKTSTYSQSWSDSAKPSNLGCSRSVLNTILVRSWSVDGGICAFSVEHGESSHIFVALIQKQCILEYNIFNGFPLRSFAFPTNMGEIMSLACGVSTKGGTVVRQKHFLCGTFERERSLDGTTALYDLSSACDFISAAEPTGSLHRCIITAGVGVSCAIIVPSLGVVVVGHRGGISLTPVDEVTTCPIACTLLSEFAAKKKTDLKEVNIRSYSLTSLQRRRTTFDALSFTPYVGNMADTHEQAKNQFCSAPLDLVALFPGPLLQDPAPVVREFMRQRERYLFYQDNFPEANGRNLSQEYSKSTNRNKKEEVDMVKVCKDRYLEPPLLLFSDEFIASASDISCGFAFLLREQLSTLGYVGVITPVAKTEFVVSGSNDGIVQFWNLCTVSEVARFRATLGLNAVTSMDVSEDASHLVVADANGYILLLDMTAVLWQSALPFNTRIAVEDHISVLRRWRGHKRSIVSVHFVRQDCGNARSEKCCFLGRRQFLRRTTLVDAISSGTKDLATASAFGSKLKTTRSFSSQRQSVKMDHVSDGEFSDQTSGNDIYTVGRSFFLCTGSEDSYIYVWRWEAGPFFDGSVHCIGCFGGSTEAPQPTPPLAKLTNCEWREMEAVRKVYVLERLLAPGGVLSGTYTKEAIESAASLIKEDLRALKKAAGLRLSALKESGCDVNVGLQQRTDDTRNSCPLTFVLAFDDDLYYERDLFELLGRLWKELEAVPTKQGGRVVAEKHRLRPTFHFSSDNAAGKNTTVTLETRHAVVQEEVAVPKLVDSLAATISVNTPALEKPDTQSLQKAISSFSLSTLPLQAASTSTPTQTVERTQEQQLSSLSSSLLLQLMESVSESQGSGFRQSGPHGTLSKTAAEVLEKEHVLPSLSSLLSAQPLDAVCQTLSRHDVIKSPSDGRCAVMQEGSRVIAICNDKWSRLPPVTVSFGSSPLPRLRGGDNVAAESGTVRSSSMKPLPLLSEVIRRPAGKIGADDQYSNGVKVLLKEQTERRLCRSAFLNDAKMPRLLSDAHAKHPDQLALKRREKKRFNEKWGPARIMSTLLRWKAPRISSASPCSTGSRLSENKDETYESSDIEILPKILTPVFFPPSMGICSPIATLGNKSLSEGKKLVLKLRDEMEEMNAKLQSKLREKQILVVQERIENETASNYESQNIFGG